MKTIYGNNIILTLSESKAFCPHCKAHFDKDMLDAKWDKLPPERWFLKVLCKCRRYVAIFLAYMGDYEAGTLQEAMELDAK